MSQIRIFVVEDSVVFRKLLLTTINSIPGVRTVGIASNGVEAIKAIPAVKPDLITLDINMPFMDGLETLENLRKVYPQFRVIMVSSYTSEGAVATLKALEAGALDFITKPDGDDNELNRIKLQNDFARLLAKYVDSDIHFDLLPEVDNAIVPEREKHPTKSISYLPSTSPLAVAIGISTGGPNALSQVIPLLPGNYPVPVFIVQHMPRLFTKTLAESLNRKSKVNVVEAIDGDSVKAGTVYLAPGGLQMKLRKDDNGSIFVQLLDAPEENFCKPSADFLFRSVAQVYGEKAVGIIMTGMGSDGVLGLRLMKRQGALVLAQDRETCTVWGMPRMACEAGVVDGTIPLHGIAEAMINAIR
jgi:two-component system, chemotaxis family, protein-glutamate methylesterase/glutaminase